MLITLYRIGGVHFASLVRMVFVSRQRRKDLLLRAPVVDRTSNMKFSRRRLADYVKTLHQKACRTCSTIIFLHSTDQIIDLWRCRWSCRRQILSSLIDHSGRQNVVRTLVTHWAALCVPLFCSYHILTLFVIFYLTDARQHESYLLINESSSLTCRKP